MIEPDVSDWSSPSESSWDDGGEFSSEFEEEGSPFWNDEEKIQNARMLLPPTPRMRPSKRPVRPRRRGDRDSEELSRQMTGSTTFREYFRYLDRDRNRTPTPTPSASQQIRTRKEPEQEKEKEKERENENESEKVVKGDTKNREQTEEENTSWVEDEEEEFGGEEPTEQDVEDDPSTWTEDLEGMATLRLRKQPEPRQREIPKIQIHPEGTENEREKHLAEQERKRKQQLLEAGGVPGSPRGRSVSEMRATVPERQPPVTADADENLNLKHHRQTMVPILNLQRLQLKIKDEDDESSTETTEEESDDGDGFKRPASNPILRLTGSLKDGQTHPDEDDMASKKGTIQRSSSLPMKLRNFFFPRGAERPANSQLHLHTPRGNQPVVKRRKDRIH